MKSSSNNKFRSNKKSNKKGQLFGDDNPETTVHGYGFANKSIASNTIKDLKNRDIDYQFQVVNTMYHRGNQVIKRMKDIDKKKNILTALNIYKTWLDDYKSNKRREKENKPYLSPNDIASLEFLAEYYNISRKARGLEKSTTSDKGFIQIWKEIALGDKKKLRNLPVKSHLPNGESWDKHRNNYLARRLSMIKNTNTGLYYTSGKYTGLPTKLHVNMIMWGYSPDSTNVLKNISNYKKIINKNN
jgi:hypothetical protein